MKRPFLKLVGASVLAACAGPNNDSPSTKPQIAEVFACGDYCPGPREQYMKKVYEGVKDEESCLAIGGKPYIYIGWDSTFICLAE